MSLVLHKVTAAVPGLMLEVSTECGPGVTAVFGPSGAGKTTVLEWVAGLRPPTGGVIQLGDRVLHDSGRKISVPARLRGIGYVPQDLALFPHLSVRENLGYGRPAAAAPGFDRVVEVLELPTLLGRGIAALSGGERQRVALGRALLAGPRLLLLDEPLAGLDAPLKARLIPFLARIRDEFRLPMLLVTHDRYEVLALADRLIVLLAGRVAQAGTVREVFQRPANLAVAGLLAVETVQPGRIERRAEGLAVVRVGSVALTAVAGDLPAGAREVFVCIRAEDVILLSATGAAASARNRLPGVVRSVADTGPLVRVELDCGFPLVVALTRPACADLELRPGATVTALIKAPHLHLIPR